jgi:quercetin dioxygenase-like cupin family protein
MFKRYVPAAAGILYAAAILLSARFASAEGDHVTPVFAKRLPNVPGKNLTAVIVFYPPGGKSVSHNHAGSVLAYVLSGAIRSQNSATGPVQVFRVGETFFEPPGSTRLISENASDTEPASLLAVFVADNGAVLTTPVQGH